ncbi:hypothetical protein [Oxalobacter paraformigenes]|uniref:Tryptophan synthase subunit beta like protein n=1 Tax=Oxalobacter paraformigenes TaxID=556268 RepID=C3X6Z5_9BURK|nr:hypothetical protein [Oxalobacter paraformigenes]EEO26908.1 hypothetical protein OFAG_00061 [Oxalobacter paraformigenes]
MPYVQRNQQGEIVALTAEPVRPDDQQLSLDSPEVLQFLAGGSSVSDRNKQYFELLAQDLQQIRILEDLIDLLTAKGVILFSELPPAAQQKILNKKNTREQLDQSNDIIVQDDALL